MTGKQRLIVIALAAVLGLALAFAFSLTGKTPQKNTGLMSVTDDVFGGPFSLQDHTGRSVTEKDFTGKYRLIYFGFTYCPAICPTELSKITNALKSLGDKGKDIQPLFITVDPERDTVEAMGKYVALFHPSLIGLTGTPEEISKTLKAYKIYAAKAKDDTMNDYTMDHSSFIYFMGPDDRLLHIFKMQDTADNMASVIAQWLDAQK